MNRQSTFCLCAPALGLLLLCGCGDDTPPRPTSRPSAAPASVNRVADSAPPATPAPPSDSDPLAPPDPLASGADTKTADPLAAGDTFGSGPAMPTAHSHWLRGPITDAQVTVSLNGIVMGRYNTPMDKDITMRLHSGVNTVTLRCHPLAPGALARLELVEGEHTPPIAPLAVLRYGAPKAGGQADRTETFTFIAH